MEILADTETTGRTVIIQEQDRIMPIDHLVDTRPEKVEKPHSSKDLIYRIPEWWFGRCRHTIGLTMSIRSSIILRSPKRLTFGCAGICAPDEQGHWACHGG
jgi:hypothetical protein